MRVWSIEYGVGGWCGLGRVGTTLRQCCKVPLQVAGGRLRWQVAGMGAQGKTGDRMMSWGYLPQH